jgi:protein-S-isoprenylcysteine O-methyltransferase Ste14
LTLGGGGLALLGWFLVFGPPVRLDPGIPRGSALAWDAGLSALFFLQHSGMVRSGFRRRLARYAPEAWFGSIYSIVSGIGLIAVVLLWQPAGEPWFEARGAVQAGLGAVLAAGLAVFVWGSAALGSLDALGVQEVSRWSRARTPEARRLTIRGPYRWVRHPLYLASLLLFWSYPAPTTDRMLFDVLWTVWVVVASILEERDLVATFGEAYRRYQRCVPMLVPWRGRAWHDTGEPG